jgi:DNA-binding MarR family transcriptional regulator
MSPKQKQSYANARAALISINLRRASQVMVRDFADSVKQYDISSAQHRMLSWIKAHPGRNQSEAATAIGMQRTNFAPIIEELEKRGLVARERADGRSNALTVTPSGAAMLRTINRKIEIHEAKFSALMTPDEKAVLLSVLHRIAAYPEQEHDG